jgi:hypothetical protein
MGLRSGIRVVSVLCAGAIVVFAVQAAQAAEMSLKAPQPNTASIWVPMFGDFIGIDTPIGVLRGASKISENESPRPADRIFFNYNYFNDVNLGKVDVHRETFGFEKTFLNGDASFGVRIPFIQFSNQDGSQTGDLSLIGKYALINQPGAVLSTGIVVTLPTGSQPLAFDFTKGQAIHSPVLQPFIGGIYNVTPDLFVQGFSSIAVPTDSRDVTMLFNSVGVGYWLYRRPATDTFITGVIPTVEAHLNTPLNHQNDGIPDRLETTVNVTGGAHIQIFNKATFGLAVGVPVSGPRPYNVEGLTSFNLRF